MGTKANTQILKHVYLENVVYVFMSKYHTKKCVHGLVEKLVYFVVFAKF